MTPDRLTEERTKSSYTFWAISQDPSWTDAIQRTATQFGTLVTLSPEELNLQEEKVERGEAAAPNIFLIDATGLRREGIQTIVRVFTQKYPGSSGIVFAAAPDCRDARSVFLENPNFDYKSKTYKAEAITRGLGEFVRTLETR